MDGRLTDLARFVRLDFIRPFIIVMLSEKVRAEACTSARVVPGVLELNLSVLIPLVPTWRPAQLI